MLKTSLDEVFREKKKERENKDIRRRGSIPVRKKEVYDC